MIFWDDMWNKSSSDESTETPVPCCGKWDKLGSCACLDKDDKGKVSTK